MRRQALDGYLADTSDSRFPRQYDIANPLPQSYYSQTHGFRGQPALSNPTSLQVSESRRPSQSSHGSLPALTSTASVRTTSSIPSSVGRRQRLMEQRILETGPGGTLQVGAPARGSLECPFNFLYCLKDFADESHWVKHSLTHFNTRTHVIDPPKRNRCCFCDEEFVSNNALASWGQRMSHIRLHHHLGHRLAIARPDFELFKYLYENHLIEDATYKDLKGNSKDRVAKYCEMKGIVPALPRASQASRLPMSPPMSPESPSSRSAITETYSPRRERRDSQRPSRPGRSRPQV